jgi:3-phenylpropionate/trans-cinnamate dioxygenase ferredoxin reductase subunit
MAETPAHVIVGAGLAGAKAAEALREEGHEGPIVLLGAERERPYERPPLSKEYLRGEQERAQAYVHDEDFYAANGIELRTGTTVTDLDTDARELETSDGERIRFHRLLLATGAEPRRLDVAGAELDGVHYLRSLEDSDAIAARLRAGSGRVVVIGAGWIGAEVAASARQKGLDVALVEAAEVPLERVLGREVGEIYARLHRDNGVELHTGTGVAAFEGPERVERVRLADGSALDCDFAVVGVGVVPRTALAERAGLAVENGIVVSARLETSAVGVFAAGDVASALHPFLGRAVRVEHWANALNQPKVAARAMLGKPAAYDRLPYFFSDQYDLGMEYRGHALHWDEVVFRGDPEAREFVAFWLYGGRVVAGMNANVWDVGDAIRALIRSRRRVPAGRLRNPDVPLEQLVQPPVATTGEEARAGRRKRGDARRVAQLDPGSALSSPGDGASARGPGHHPGGAVRGVARRAAGERPPARGGDRPAARPAPARGSLRGRAPARGALARARRGARGHRDAGGRRRADGCALEARRLPRREPLHDLGVQVRPARGGREAAPARLAGPRGRPRRRELAGLRRPRRERAREARARRAARGAEAGRRGRAHAAPARGVRGARAQRGADRRARGAAQHDPRRALQDAARRAAEAASRAGGGWPGGGWTMNDEHIERLLGPTGQQVTCEQCFELIDEYVDLELAGADADARVPGMRAHLDGCPACREEHDSLRALAGDSALDV